MGIPYFLALMIAIIRTGGKQYGVSEGARLKVEKVAGEVGETVVFSDVLLAGDDKNVKVGMPLLAKASVSAKIIEHGRAEKIVGVKHKPKKRYSVKFGHRQPFTLVEIERIAA